METKTLQLQKINTILDYQVQNKNLLGYDQYLQSKQEGRWLVYSWAAFFMQPFFFIFYKMPFELLLYILIFSFLSGLNYLYGISFILLFPLFAFKIYELKNERVYFLSLKKYKKFQKKYSKEIDTLNKQNNEINKIKSNNNLTDKQKNKRISNISNNIKWKYNLFSPLTYFLHISKPKSFIFSFISIFTLLLPYTILGLFVFSLNNSVAKDFFNILEQEVNFSNKQNVVISPSDDEQLKNLIQIYNFPSSISDNVNYYLDQKIITQKDKKQQNLEVDIMDFLLDGKEISPDNESFINLLEKYKQ